MIRCFFFDSPRSCRGVLFFPAQNIYYKLYVDSATNAHGICEYEKRRCDVRIRMSVFVCVYVRACVCVYVWVCVCARVRVSVWKRCSARTDVNFSSTFDWYFWETPSYSSVSLRQNENRFSWIIVKYIERSSAYCPTMCRRYLHFQNWRLKITSI